MAGKGAGLSAGPMAFEKVVQDPVFLHFHLSLFHNIVVPDVGRTYILNAVVKSKVSTTATKTSTKTATTVTTTTTRRTNTSTDVFCGGDLLKLILITYVELLFA